MKSEEFINLDKNHIIQCYGSRNLVFVKGQGSYLFTKENKKYLDFTTGISVCNLGHSHPKITKAIQDQACKLLHISNLFINNITPLLAQKLTQLTGLSKVFFANSGAEANEGLIKLARKWGNPLGKNQIITMINSFHGRTLATINATGRKKYRQGFEPELAGFKNVQYNDLEALENAIDKNIAAILLEPLLAEGGIIQPKQGYLQGVRKLCDKYGILMLLDEVQTGMGRTGKMFAHQHYAIKPDAMSLAKALANGLPMGAFIVADKYDNILKAGEHASTFGGTAIVSAAAKRTLEIFEEENILANVNIQSAYLKGKINDLKKKFSFITDVRISGLFIGIDVGDIKANIVEKARDKNLLILTAGDNTLRLLPPLNVTKSECDQALIILTEIFKQVA